MPEKDDACEKCTCEDGFVPNPTPITNQPDDLADLLRCDCPCHLTDQERYEYDQDARLHEKQQEGER